jgi:hypothetical protein
LFKFDRRDRVDNVDNFLLGEKWVAVLINRLLLFFVVVFRLLVRVISSALRVVVPLLVLVLVVWHLLLLLVGLPIDRDVEALIHVLLLEMLCVLALLVAEAHVHTVAEAHALQHLANVAGNFNS